MFCFNLCIMVANKHVLFLFYLLHDGSGNGITFLIKLVLIHSNKKCWFKNDLTYLKTN